MSRRNAQDRISLWERITEGYTTKTGRRVRAWKVKSYEMEEARALAADSGWVVLNDRGWIKLNPDRAKELRKERAECYPFKTTADTEGSGRIRIESNHQGYVSRAMAADDSDPANLEHDGADVLTVPKIPSVIMLGRRAWDSRPFVVCPVCEGKDLEPEYYCARCDRGGTSRAQLLSYQKKVRTANRIRRAYHKGKSLTIIASELGIDRSNLYKIMNEVFGKRWGKEYRRCLEDMNQRRR